MNQVAERAYKGQGYRTVKHPVSVAESIDPDAEPPMCGVHEMPMVLMHGRRGDFWSCHEKNPDGSWCSYKPKG